MTYKVLSKKDAKIFTAMGSGIIPRGGSSFELGAADLSDKWLPRSDYLLSRMNFMTRTGMRFLIKGLNYIWPLLYLRRFSQMTGLTEKDLTTLFHNIETSGSGVAALILAIKVLICPAFYGLDEVKTAIGYQEKFPNSPNFEGIKD